MKDTNMIIKNMKKELKEKMDNDSLTLEALDDITYNCAQELKQIVQDEAKETLEQNEKVKKKNAQHVGKLTNQKNTIH